MDCGTKHKGGPIGQISTKDKEPKVSYPSFTLTDEKAAAFLKEFKAEVGDTLTGGVKLDVTGMRDDEFGKSVTLSVVELNDIAEAKPASGEDEPDDEDDAEEKPAKVNKAVRRMMREA